MKRKLFLSIFILLSLLLLLSACLVTKKAGNLHVNNLLEEIKKLEDVQKVEICKRGFSLIIDVYVEEGFTKEGSLKILELAKEYLDVNTVNELTMEFNQEYPPDTDIFIRDMDGNILFGISGSCYESYHRGIPPDYTQYVWSIS